ncbi:MULTISPECIES: hypothetical protein [unclassified Desulfovibrio]|uniref:hypothetical protein n=1 Tax=unclassified Desulfovibrio TaxID=2593640 RepID=UPI0013EA357A|nr:MULTISPECIES: hypothetical protein [unclassified Desulfovibrio]
MVTLRFTENGKDFPIPCSLLKSMAQACPDGQAGRDLGKALIALGIPSITGELLQKGFLTAEDRDAIWATGDTYLRRKLLKGHDFIADLTDAQAREIVEEDDVEMLESVGKWCEYLYPVFGGADRISGAAADNLMEHIRNHANASVRATLAKNIYTPQRFKPPLTEYIRNGYDMWTYPFAELSVEDVALYKGQPWEVLQDLAGRVGDIEDVEARKAVVTLLAHHPDPAVRLALANNGNAPRLAFELLAADADPEIAALAAEKLEKA